MRNDIKKYILFVVFTAASFLTLLGLSLYQCAISAEFGRYYWLGESTIMLVLWLPYAIMAVSGVFAACSVFSEAESEKEELGLAVSSLAAGIGIILITVLAVKMKIRIPALEGLTAVIWSDYCARPSMALAGVFIANGIRHFIGAKKYNE